MLTQVISQQDNLVSYFFKYVNEQYKKFKRIYMYFILKIQ